MKDEHLLIIAVLAIGGYFLYTKSQAAAVTPVSPISGLSAPVNTVLTSGVNAIGGVAQTALSSVGNSLKNLLSNNSETSGYFASTSIG